MNKKPWTGPKASSGRLEQLGLFLRMGNELSRLGDPPLAEPGR